MYTCICVYIITIATSTCQLCMVHNSIPRRYLMMSAGVRGLAAAQGGQGHQRQGGQEGDSGGGRPDGHQGQKD